MELPTLLSAVCSPFYAVIFSVFFVLFCLNRLAHVFASPPKLKDFEHHETAYHFPLGSPRKTNPIVFVDIAISEQFIGRIIIELKADVVPTTASNFLLLCKGTKGFGFKNSCFHRLCRFAIYAGDFELSDGTGGHSALTNKQFPDENYVLQHKPGVVAMAKRTRSRMERQRDIALGQKERNGSQFYITTAETPWLDGRNVVVGQVLKGYSVVKAIDSVRIADGGAPPSEIRIIDSGQLFSHPKKDAAKSKAA